MKIVRPEEMIYIYIFIYIYVTIGGKNRDCTFISTSLFHDCSLIWGFYSLRIFEPIQQWHTQLRLMCHFFLFLPHFDVICDLLLNRRMATWNLFVKDIYSCKTANYWRLWDGERPCTHRNISSWSVRHSANDRGSVHNKEWTKIKIVRLP